MTSDWLVSTVSVSFDCPPYSVNNTEYIPTQNLAIPCFDVSIARNRSFSLRNEIKNAAMSLLFHGHGMLS